jgi:hypothetical protein
MIISEIWMVEDVQGHSCYVTDVLKNTTQNIAG